MCVFGNLARIKAQEVGKSKLGMDVLIWLSHSERPLKANELCSARGVEIGTTDLNIRNIPAMETLLECSLGLVTVEASTCTINLIHHTLREYLSANADLFHSTHALIAEACLTYLNFQCIRDLSPVRHGLRLETPLLEYASCCWGTHAAREITEEGNMLALKLLDGLDRHISSRILLTRNGDTWGRELYRSGSTRFAGLHGAAYFGLAETAVALLNMRKWDLGATDVAGNTAILWAARNGHRVVLEALLEQEGATPNTADQEGLTPLSLAE